jgi:hypothetical protein
MEEHFEATGEVTHLNDDMTIEASKSDYSEVPAEDQSQEQPTQQQEPQPQEQPAQSGGQGQGQRKQSSRARAAVGESKKKSNGSGKSKQQRQPQAQANDQQPAQEAAEEPTSAEEEQPADSTPHDPETGEVIEATAEEVPWDNDVGGDDGSEETRGESQEEEQADVEGVDMPYGKRGPDIDGWFNKVIEKLNSYTHPQQVERFRVNCKPQIDMLGNMSKSTADEAHKLFDDRIQELNEDGSSPI